MDHLDEELRSATLDILPGREKRCHQMKLQVTNLSSQAFQVSSPAHAYGRLF